MASILVHHVAGILHHQIPFFGNPPRFLGYGRFGGIQHLLENTEFPSKLQPVKCWVTKSNLSIGLSMVHVQIVKE